MTTELTLLEIDDRLTRARALIREATLGAPPWYASALRKFEVQVVPEFNALIEGVRRARDKGMGP